MWQAIISNTPYWVWALLAFLLYRGGVALTDREVGLKKIIVIPLVMFGLSLQGLLSQFYPQREVLAMALLAAGISAAWAWRATPGNVAVITPPAGASAGATTVLLFVRGSWRPLAMMVAVFALKYSVGVARVIEPALLQQALVTMTLGLLYGMVAGLSLGRVLRICQLFRRAQPRLPVATA